MKNIQIKKSKSYNKTLIVGHELSGHESVIDLLNASGMGFANPIRNGLLSASKISQTLLKAHKMENNNTQQLQINPLWNGLALDLLINNLDQRWWGWSDSNAVFLLDYWKSLDSNMAFVLVYDTPLNFIKQTLNNLNSITEENLKNAINTWCTYNQILLNFYYRNPNCCLLVNTQQVKTKSSDYLEQVRKQIGMEQKNIDNQAIKILQKSFEADIADTGLFDYLAHDILAQYPQIQKLYDELQSTADFPYYNLIKESHNPLDALSILFSEKQILKDLNNIKKRIKKENLSLLNQLLYTHEELETTYNEQQEIIQQKNTLKNQLDKVNMTLEEYHITNEKMKQQIDSIPHLEAKIKSDLDKKYRKEREDLLQQHMQAQEALENYHLTNKKMKQQIDSIPHLEAKVKTDFDRKHTKEKEHLLQQLMQAQEALEEYYIENKNLQQKLTSVSKPHEKEKYFGAAERIKSQLSYRLGAILIMHSKSFSGLFKMPFILRKEIKKFRKERKERKKLPPIESYVDAYEAKKVKQHLSYRLGKTMINYSNKPFGYLRLPLALRKVYKEFNQGKPYVSR